MKTKCRTKLMIVASLFALGVAMGMTYNALFEQSRQKPASSIGGLLVANNSLFDAPELQRADILAITLERLLASRAGAEAAQNEIDAILTSLVTEDPHRVLALFQDGLLTRAFAAHLDTAVKLILAKEPDYLINSNITITDWVTASLCRIALREATKRDPAMALQQYDALGLRDISILEEIIQNAPLHERELRWSSFWASRTKDERAQLLKRPAIWEHWINRGPGEFIRNILSLDTTGSEKKQVLHALLSSLTPMQAARISLSDQEAISRLGVELNLGPQDALLNTLRAAGENPIDALNEITANDDYGIRYTSELSKRILAEALRRDPEQAIEYASSVSSHNVRGFAYESYAIEKTRSDPKAAIEWARSIQDPVVADASRMNVLTTWAETDLFGSLQFLAEEQDFFDNSLSYRSTLEYIIGSATATGLLQPSTVSVYRKIYGALNPNDQHRLRSLIEGELGSSVADHVLGSAL